MNYLHNPIFYAVLMLLSGIGIPIMVVLNAGLGGRLQSPVLATTILFMIGFFISCSFLLIVEGIPKSFAYDSVPVHFYMGALFIVFYIICATWVAPRFGVGNAIVFVLLGQLISIAIIDHYSLFGAIHNPISVQRFIGLLLMALGAFLAMRRF